MELEWASMKLETFYMQLWIYPVEPLLTVLHNITDCFDWNVSEVPITIHWVTAADVSMTDPSQRIVDQGLKGSYRLKG